MSFTIAIDGPAAAGKGTLAQALSAHFGFAYLDTGLLYRAVGAGVIAGGDPVAVAQALDPSDLNADTLRTQAVAEAASRVAVIPDVRAALVAFQRSFARRDGGAVLDGRDIGTVICPDADVKLFVTASAEIRADRRFAELTAKGVQTDLAAILDEVRARDDRDQNRAEAPLIAAADATLIDTTSMTAAEALAQAITIVTAKRA
ncbi:cytidylate kinase [Loktanella salsilacus]|jgi:cytidylate kinase|uniref:Cytidylate kinase n=1 Tax=Loktanella salsilacus TaxID=195913 RepID=A0A1I4EKM3_9RHOB|nr:d(CMP) kinase [Loktanella salsilacus]MBU0779591.1 cytidylate kinase [Alphaproteobacteria bacterium]SFL06285.1 cytidylate kinase [Loktanella salsilacus]